MRLLYRDSGLVTFAESKPRLRAHVQLRGLFMHTYCRAAAALLFITIGAGYAATKPAPVPAHAPVRAAHPTAPDAEVEKAIRARFAASKISTHKFQVHVQGGVATIEGQTDVLQHKGVATRLAKSAGAIKVVNQIGRASCRER